MLNLTTVAPRACRRAWPAERGANLNEECKMKRMLSIAAGLAVVVAASGAVQAASKCDSGVSKAIGKYVSCLCAAYSKSQKKDVPPDFGKCNAKFNGATGACQKAQSKGDCLLFGGAGECASKAADCLADAADLCNASPSGAFIE